MNALGFRGQESMWIDPSEIRCTPLEIAAHVDGDHAAETRGLAAAKKANGETLDKLKGGGMQILQPSAQLKADMKKVGDTMLKEWLEKAGPEGKQLIDAFQK